MACLFATTRPNGDVIELGGDLGIVDDDARGRGFDQLELFAYSASVQETVRLAILGCLQGGPQRTVVSVELPRRGLTPVEATFVEMRRPSAESVVGIQLVVPDTQDAFTEALRDSQRTLANLMSCWPGVAVRWGNDPNYTTIYASEGCLEVTGYPAAAFVSGEVKFGSLIHPDDADKVWTTTSTAVADHERFTVEYRITDASGRTRWLWSRGRGVYDAYDNLQFVEGFVSEVTEMKAAQDMALRAHRLEAVEAVAGGVAHDFNNVLAGLMGRAELLGIRHPELREEVDTLLLLCRQGASLTRQLLTLTDGQVLERTALDLGELVREMEPAVRQFVRDDVEIRIEAEPAWIAIDRTQAEQLVLNLSVNASDAMEEGGVLHIAVADAGEDVTLTVSDTGNGMTAETLAHVFEPYYSTRGERRGIGLAIVQRIVEQVGGRIDVDSTVGRGSTFTVSIPPAEGRPRAATTHAAATATAPPSGRARVLLVDNDAAIREVAGRLLADVDIELVTVASSDEAMEHLRSGSRVDVLVTDVVLLPGLGGYDLAQRARSIHPDVRVLFISGYAPDARIQESVDAGRAEFLAKPYTKDQMTAKILGRSAAET